MIPPLPLDDPAWATATDAFLKTEAPDDLRRLYEGWDEETADYLLFSALLHQDTVYPATFLALPHIIALAPEAPAEAQGLIAAFLAGVALHAQLPRTSGGVSLQPGDPFPETDLGQRATRIFQECLPDTARLCQSAFAADPFTFYASGVAAADGNLPLAAWLAAQENGAFLCPACQANCTWLLFGDDLAVYRDQYPLDDWHAGQPDTAAGIATKHPEPPEVTKLRTRLGPPDPTTNALLLNYRATVTCPACAWQGEIPDPRLP